MGHLLLAAPHKSSGKTTVTLGLCAALKRAGHGVQAFKKGPDYIDPMWLGRACGRPCHNLDFHTQDSGEIVATFLRYRSEINLIEGNMGLFDSLDVEGSGSNASLAALLGAPVILVVNAQGMTRSIVPLLLGYQQFDPSIRIAGVILNNVAGGRHGRRLREAIQHYTDLPLLGLIERNPDLVIHERHLGLIPSEEAEEVDRKLDFVAGAIGSQVDLPAVIATAAEAHLPSSASPVSETAHRAVDLRLGIFQDPAFNFYYPGDLDRLREGGAELVPVNALRDPALPPVDGLFIGGGFPETQAPALEANRALRRHIRHAIEAGLPVYAECGGLMYLTRTIQWQGRRHEMVGVVPADTVMHKRPQGRGYVRLRETAENPWPRAADTPAQFNAHEFHYSSLENVGPGLHFAYEVQRGTGIDGRHDGIVYKNLVANYAHLRDVDRYHWTGRFLDFIRARRAGKLTAQA